MGDGQDLYYISQTVLLVVLGERTQLHLGSDGQFLAVGDTCGVHRLLPELAEYSAAPPTLLRDPSISTPLTRFALSISRLAFSREM